MRYLQKSLPLFLISFLLVQMALPFFAIRYRQHQYTQRAKQFMKKEYAMRLSAESVIHASDFKVVKEGKEFLYNGHLYDFVSYTKEEGNYFIWAVIDDVEHAFLRDLKQEDPTQDDDVWVATSFFIQLPAEFSFCFSNASTEIVAQPYVPMSSVFSPLNDGQPPELRS